MIKNVSEIIKQQFNKGLNTHKNFFNLQEGQSPACLNVQFNNDGSFGKRLGSSTMNTVALEGTGFGMYDVGIINPGADEYTVLLLHCDGADASTTFSDSSPSNKTVTANGNAQIDTAQSKFGGASGLFDGTGDYLTVPDSADWNFAGGDFTIDFQARWADQSGTTVLCASWDDFASAADKGWRFRLTAADALSFDYTTNGSTEVSASFGTWSPSINTWYHIALIRSGTDLKYFIDGVQQGSTYNISTDSIFNAAELLFVGAVNNSSTGATGFHNGWFDEFRISKGIARWTANFTPPADAYSSALIQRRRLLCASGTGIYFSSDIGKTWTIIQTNRTATINYFGFVKDYIINTNEEYQTPQYWAGSANVYFANISTATPMCKHSVSHQGFAILLNESANKTSFYYVDQNDMFTKVWSNFKLPSDRNDELTLGFELGRALYVSAKYRIFRLDYIGGNPDWTYVEVRGWGFVPKTVKKINIPGAGEAVIGLDWTKKIRLFLGLDDEIISDNVQQNNEMTPFYLDNINALKLNECWAENDKKNQIYKLYLVYGGSSTVSYCLNFNYRTGAWYPDDDTPFPSGVLANDTADNLYMLACDYNGYIHQINSGNTRSGVAINEYYVSPFLYQQSPSHVHKGQQIDMFFSVSSSGTIYFEDRNQFSNVWDLRKTMTLANAISSVQIRHTIDIPETMNVYQFKLSSSANTAEPWRCNLIDYSQSNLGIGKE